MQVSDQTCLERRGVDTYCSGKQCRRMCTKRSSCQHHPLSAHVRAEAANAAIMAHHTTIPLNRMEKSSTSVVLDSLKDFVGD